MPGISENGNNIISDMILDIITYCSIKNIEFIIGCDSNAHHSIWNSVTTDTRGETLVDFISSNNIILLNQGDKATFCPNDNRNIQSHIDLTLSSINFGKLIKNGKSVIKTRCLIINSGVKLFVRE